MPTIGARALTPALSFSLKWNRARGALVSLSETRGGGMGPPPAWQMKGARVMNWDQIKGNWKQMSGDAKAKWGELTDDDLKQAEGDRDKLVGRVQERYGIEKEEAQRQVDEFAAKH